MSRSEDSLLTTRRASGHFDSYMHPQAVFIDSSAAEEDYFLSAARDMVRRTRSALIELPENPRTSLAWVTKLDAAALSGRSYYTSFSCAPY